MNLPTVNDKQIIEILKKQPVTGDLFKDIKTAKKYVADYLYNQDSVIDWQLDDR